METINIKGKEYVQVNERIKEFRTNPAYNNWSLVTEIVSHVTDSMGVFTIVMKAFIRDERDRIIATGYAYEKENSSFINKTSYIENCETSAWGRALGNLGIGVDTSIASFEEVGNAIKQQEQPKKYPAGPPEQSEHVSNRSLTITLNKLNNKIKELQKAGKLTDDQAAKWQESIEHLDSEVKAKAMLASLESIK